MSSGRVFFALVAIYVGIVLWYAAFGDSLGTLAGLRARLRHRSRERGGRRYLAAALAGAVVAGLTTLAVVGMRDVGAKGKVDPEAALGPQSADPAPPRPSRALVSPATTHLRASVRITRRKRPARVQRATKAHTKVVSDLVNVSANVAPPASTTVSTQVAHRVGPVPLRAPAGSGAPNPLAAP